MQLFDKTLCGDALARTRHTIRLLIARYMETHRAADAEQQLAELRALSPAEETEWRGILTDWEALDNWTLRDNCPPENIPDAPETAFAVLGHELREDGTPGSELLGRLRLALACAERYPMTKLLLCGGATCRNYPAVTEAAVMRRWLLDAGVADGRLLLEQRSTSTNGNAFFGIPVAAEAGITAVSVVTSRYHVHRGSLVFSASAHMLARERGTEPIRLLPGGVYYDPAFSEKMEEEYEKRPTDLVRLYDLPWEF